MKTKKLIAITAILLTILFCSAGANAASKARGNAKITNYSMSHNQYYNNSKGFYIYYSFVVNGMQGRQLKCVATLYRSNGSKIHFYNGSVASATWYCTPGYPTTNFNNNWFFFPYNLNVPYGYNPNCYAIIRIYDAASGRVLGKSSKITFNYTRS